MCLIEKIENIVVLPNIMTEVDNLLNDFSGNWKYLYITQLITLIKSASEEYLHSDVAADNQFFQAIGITDSLILDLALRCDALITSDSVLADYARALGIDVMDLVELRNREFKS